jgi:hypothetical protein
MKLFESRSPNARRVNLSLVTIGVGTIGVGVKFTTRESLIYSHIVA